jgi:hypothetical protein
MKMWSVLLVSLGLLDWLRPCHAEVSSSPFHPGIAGKPKPIQKRACGRSLVMSPKPTLDNHREGGLVTAIAQVCLRDEDYRQQPHRHFFRAD